jgi:hypothetical protein
VLLKQKRLKFKPLDFEESKLPAIIWWASSNQLEVLIEKRWSLPRKRGFCLQSAFGLEF